VEQQVVAMAEWMIHMMDRPPGWRPSYQEIWNPATREYRVPIPHQHLVTAGFAGDHHSGAHRGRESRRYLVTRRPELWPFAGATDSVDLADWLIRKLDLPAKAPQSTSAQAKESGRPDTNANLYRLATP